MRWRLASIRTRSLRALPLLLAAGLPGQERRAEFLLFKPGDPAATAERAAAFVHELAEWLGRHVDRFEGAAIRGWITNREARATDLATGRTGKPGGRPPEMAIVPAAFWLRHLRKPELAAQVVAEVPRFGKRVDRWYLVARKDGGPMSLTGLQGKRVRTRAGIDLSFLSRVVFPEDAEPGTFFELETSSNLADDVFLMIEGGAVGEDAQAPDALLLDEELLQFFTGDELVWPHIAVVWQSEPLPRDLVVTLGSDWTAAQRSQLEKALLAMSEDESGQRLLRLMRSDGFAAPDRELLARTAEAYDRDDAGRPRKEGNGSTGSDKDAEKHL